MVLFIRKYLLVMLLALSLIVGCSSPKKDTVSDVEPSSDTIKVEKVEKTVSKVPEKTDSDKQAVSKPETNAGLLTVDSKVYDFGRIEPGGLKHGKFVLKNDGKANLEISRVTAPCRCTTPGKLNGRVLAPGESVDLDFTFNVGSSHGKVQKKINIALKSPSKPNIMTLTFKADIIQVLEVTPSAMSFGLHSSYDNNQTIIVNSTDGTEFKITGVISNKNAVSARHADSEDSKLDTSVKAKMHKLTVDVDLEKLKVSPAGLLTIKTDHPKVNRIVVRYNTKMPYAAYPKTKRLVPTTESGRHARIKVVSNFKEDFELGEITSKAGYLDILETRPSVDGYEVHVKLNMDKVKQMEQNKRYVSDHLLIPIAGNEEVLEVHCYGMVR